ncbi:hypothetical protein CFOL_v3_24194, partial [Cephalotus follicularis]
DSLKEMYGQANNYSRIFELQQEITQSRQGSNQLFTEHLEKLKKRWDEIRQYCPVTHSVTDFVQREEQDRIFQFLASIKPEYEYIKRQILMNTTLPSFVAICATIQREETRSRVMEINHSTCSSENSTHAVTHNERIGNITQSRPGRGKSRGRGTRPHSDHCSRDGHTKDKCYILHPHLIPVRGKPQETKVANRVQQESPDIKLSLEKLSNQFQQLLQHYSSSAGPNNNTTKTGNLASTSGNVHAL